MDENRILEKESKLAYKVVAAMAGMRRQAQSNGEGEDGLSAFGGYTIN